MERVEEILRFWFLDSTRTDAPLQAHMRRWFQRSTSFDRCVRHSHGNDIDQALHGQLDHWADTSHGRLGLILLLDQMTRNAFRGTIHAFAGDMRAISLSLEGIDLGADRGLVPIERLFFYLPLFHSERRSDQRFSVACFENLASEAPSSQRDDFAVWAAHARQQALLLQRFGRFPGRNRAMGRRSTPWEWRFLLGAATQAFASGISTRLPMRHAMAEFRLKRRC